MVLSHIFKIPSIPLFAQWNYGKKSSHPSHFTKSKIQRLHFSSWFFFKKSPRLYAFWKFQIQGPNSQLVLPKLLMGRTCGVKVSRLAQSCLEVSVWMWFWTIPGQSTILLCTWLQKWLLWPQFGHKITISRRAMKRYRQIWYNGRLFVDFYHPTVPSLTVVDWIHLTSIEKLNQFVLVIYADWPHSI